MPFGQRNIFAKIIKDIFKINETIKQRLFFYLQSQLEKTVLLSSMHEITT